MGEQASRVDMREASRRGRGKGGETAWEVREEVRGGKLEGMASGRRCVGYKRGGKEKEREGYKRGGNEKEREAPVMGVRRASPSIVHCGRGVASLST
jgi:hypothetical protein